MIYRRFLTIAPACAAFFAGASLKPLPPGRSTTKNARYLDIHEQDRIDEVQLGKWIKQAAKLPGFLAPKI